MSEIKLTKNSIENAILTDGKLVGGYVDGDGYIGATGNGSFARGYVKLNSSYPDIPSKINASGTASHAEGCASGGVIDASGIGSFAHGYANLGTISANGDGAHAEGYAYLNSIDASGNGAHAEGCSTKALANEAHAEGYLSIASGAHSHAEGKITKTYATASHAEGGSTTAKGDYSHAEGYWTTASGTASHAEGYWTTASGTASHAEGYLTFALGEQSHAEGKGSTGSLGSVSTASGNQFTLKSISTTVSELSCTLQVGDIVNCDSSYAKVTTINTSNSSTAITTDKELGVETGNIKLIKGISYGANAHSEGYLTAATENYAHAEGYLTIASGYDAHAEGYLTTAKGECSHAEGNETTASGRASHAEGYLSKASGDYSHAEGCGTKALADGAHAEGNVTKALGDGAHAEGQGKTSQVSFGPVLNATDNFLFLKDITNSGYTLKVGDIINYDRKCTIVISITKNINGFVITTDKEIGIQKTAYVSLAEGGISSGECAHSEGYLTMAIENYAHAEGYLTIASGTASHAGGYGTIADKEAMTAIGKYNNTSIGNIGGDYLFVVGNGSSASSRSNAFAVTTNGITASLLNLSGGSYQDLLNPGSGYPGYPGGKISWSDGNCWIAELKIFGDDETDILTIFSSGKLYLKSNSRIYANTNITVTGQVNATGGFYDESDIRKKDVLSNISLEKSYELLDKCQEIIYVLKDDPNKKELVGMIAQEVEEFFPEIVSTDNNGFKSLDYARLSVICLRIIKDIVELIKEIKNEIKNING